jgi:hypothetical protein
MFYRLTLFSTDNNFRFRLLKSSAVQISTDKAVGRECVLPTVGKCLGSRQTKTSTDELRRAGYGVKLKLSYGAARRRRRMRRRRRKRRASKGRRKGIN